MYGSHSSQFVETFSNASIRHVLQLNILLHMKRQSRPSFLTHTVSLVKSLSSFFLISFILSYLFLLALQIWFCFGILSVLTSSRCMVLSSARFAIRWIKVFENISTKMSFQVSLNSHDPAINRKLEAYRSFLVRIMHILRLETCLLHQSVSQ